MIRLEEDLKQYFINDSPEYYNKEGLAILIDRLWSCHKTKKDKDQFISRLIKYKKNNTEDEWYSLYAEMHSLYLVNKNLSENNFAVFSKENDNDLSLFENSVNKSIEVKSVLLKNFEKKYDTFWNKLASIPSGKAIRFTIKNPQKLTGIFKEVERLQKQGIDNYDGENIKIEVIGDISNKNKTALLGQAIFGWIPTEDFSDLIVRKIQDKNNQINKADIVIFYLHDSTYDVEDVCEALEKANDKIAILKDKNIKCFTKWSGGELIDLFYNNHKWTV